MQVPISALSPYLPSKWQLRARVVEKAAIKTWSNARGTGQLFSATLVDDQGDAIRATFFQGAVTKFHDMLQNSQVYLFSNGQVKISNKKFNKLACDYELSFSEDAVVEQAGDDGTIAKDFNAYLSLDKLEAKENGSPVDVLGVVLEIREESEITTKTGEKLMKRVVVLGDSSNCQIELTLWQNEARNFPTTCLGAPIGVRNCRVNDFGGCAISMTQMGSIDYNPSVEGVATLRQWYAGLQAVGGVASLRKLKTVAGGEFGQRSDERKPISTIKDDGLGGGEKPDFLTVRGTITFLKPENLWYTACPTCNKKVVQHGDGSSTTHRCEKCGVNVKAIHRYILSGTIADASAQSWVTLFQDTAETIMGISAEELAQKELESPGIVKNAVKAVCFKEHVFRLRVKQEVIQDESRVKATVQSCEPVSYGTESTKLLSQIDRYLPGVMV